MIAYVDSEMRVVLARSDGSEAQRLEGPGKTHLWPVWSPDGSRLLFSGFTSGSNGSGFLGLNLNTVGERHAHTIYTNEHGTDAIAQRTPHYTLWSPDGRRLGLVAKTWRPGLSLFVIGLDNFENPRRLINGMPLFLSWSFDSRHLLIHSGTEHYIVDFDGDIELVKMPGRSGLYMAPSWSPSSNKLSLLRQLDGEKQVMFILDTESADVKLVTEVEGSAAFSWSPNGETIVITSGLQGQSRFYRGLKEVSAEGRGDRSITDDLILSFYWSPKGDKIAYVTLSEDAEGSTRWGIVDVESGDTCYLGDFRPTQEQLTAFMFFDQYAQSHNPWSPDGSSIIFAGELGYEKKRTVLPTEADARVLVADVEGQQPPATVGKGIMGFWSRG